MTKAPTNCVSFGNYGEDWSAFLQQDPVCVFMNGACHVYARELAEFLKAQFGIQGLLFRVGDTPRMGFPVPDVTIRPTCKHVVLEVGQGRYLDVELRTKEVPELTQRFTASEVAGLNDMEVECLFSANPDAEADRRTNIYGMRIDDPFFKAACVKARAHLLDNKHRIVEIVTALHDSGPRS